MRKKVVVVPVATPEWLKKCGRIRAEIWRQLLLGLDEPGKGLTLEQLQLVTEHHNPFEKKPVKVAVSEPVSPAEALRRVEIVSFRKFAYEVDETAVPLPDSAKLLFGLAILVDYKTPIDRQCNLLGIKNYLNLAYHKDLHPKPQGRWGWIYGVEDGRKMLGRSPNDCVAEFGRNARRGLMTVEGFALYRVKHSDLLRDHYVDLPGSRCGGFDGGAPDLYLGGGQAALDSVWAADGPDRWGSASAESV